MHITIVDVTHHHMPNDHLIGYSYERIKPGMTLRQAPITAARATDWGNMGGATAYLSDDTELSVELFLCEDGSRLLSSQEAIRYDGPKVIRKYSIR